MISIIIIQGKSAVLYSSDEDEELFYFFADLLSFLWPYLFLNNC